MVKRPETLPLADYGKLEQLKDMEREQKYDRDGKRQGRPVDSIEKSRQNAKYGLKQIEKIADVPED
jgi:hypothetical protein